MGGLAVLIAAKTMETVIPENMAIDWLKEMASKYRVVDFIEAFYPCANAVEMWLWHSRASKFRGRLLFSECLINEGCIYNIICIILFYILKNKYNFVNIKI